MEIWKIVGACIVIIIASAIYLYQPEPPDSDNSTFKQVLNQAVPAFCNVKLRTNHIRYGDYRKEFYSTNSLYIPTWISYDYNNDGILEKFKYLDTVSCPSVTASGYNYATINLYGVTIPIWVNTAGDKKLYWKLESTSSLNGCWRFEFTNKTELGYYNVESKTYNPCNYHCGMSMLTGACTCNEYIGDITEPIISGRDPNPSFIGKESYAGICNPNDYDNDGVLNDLDTCQETPANIIGLPYITFPNGCHQFNWGNCRTWDMIVNYVSYWSDGKITDNFDLVISNLNQWQTQNC